MSSPILLNLNEVQPQTNSWLWPGRIPLGAITTLIGYGGEGKSSVACAIASIISRGGQFPDGTEAPQGAVVMMAGEDLPAKLRARYEANGADLEKITLLQGQRFYIKSSPVETNITLRDIDLIREAIDKTPNVKLLIIDPIGDFIPGVNSDKDNEVRALLNPLAQLAQERQLAILMICHRKKGAGDRADNTALGSVAFTAKARAVHHVILDPYEPIPSETAPQDGANSAPQRRLFLPGKLNDQEQARGLAFRIVSSTANSTQGADSVGARGAGIVQWEEVPIDGSADTVMAYASAKAKAERAADSHSLRDAELWLRESLKDGARPARDLTAAARAEGIAPRTLRRAKQTLGVTHTRVSRQGVFLWELSSGSTNDSGTAHLPQSSPPAAQAKTPELATESWYWPVAATVNSRRPVVATQASEASEATVTEREILGQ